MKYLLILLVLFQLSCSQSSNWAVDLSHAINQDVKPIDGAYYHTAEVIVDSQTNESLNIYIDRTRFFKKKVKMTKNIEQFVKEVFEKELMRRGFQIKKEAAKQLYIKINDDIEEQNQLRKIQDIPELHLKLTVVENKNVLFEKSYKKQVAIETQDFFRVKETEKALNQAFEAIFIEVFKEKKMISSLLN